ncbi:hypothetical protein AX16_005207 [Volvariella volvacea WC 439]|nr:hypothetical protein AX16_005207 [Volvariella volvacea WC 439]
MFPRLLAYPLSLILFVGYLSFINAYETVQEAAVISRRLVDHSNRSIATMATVFPSDEPVLNGQPFSMQEYYASCHKNGSLTLLFLPISRHSRNIQRSPNHHASLSITSEIPAAAHARVSLIGNVIVYQDARTMPNVDDIKRCYLEKHPDARWWLPDDERAAHLAYWARFDPHTIYFVGGFGDEHYIGYIPLWLYQRSGRSATEETADYSPPVNRILLEQA